MLGAGASIPALGMMWTVFQQLPIERRLERIAEAGYRSVELVTEFTEWSDEDFRRINEKRRAQHGL